jgi:hypothetical protein
MSISKVAWIVLGTIFSQGTHAKQIDMFNDMQLDISGYVGWKQINSTVKYSNIKSSPELGLTTSLKISESLTFFNQYKYGNSINSALVYAQLNYQLPIPIEDLVVTAKVGKLRHSSSLYSATRVNPLTRQGVFLPQSIYWDQLGQAITSGTGVGIDIKYKDLLVTALVDKPVVTNHIKDGQALTGKNYGTMTIPFGHPLVTVQYEVPEYNIRTQFSWERFQLHYQDGLPPDNILASSRHPNTITADLAHQGIEWRHEDWTMSFETQLVKRIGVNWFEFGQVAIGTSTTVEYDVNENISLRANYNTYLSRVPSREPQGKYFKDLNIGMNWHEGNWMMNIEGHYNRGGKTVDTDNYIRAPDDYKHYFVTGFNIVYFWD